MKPVKHPGYLLLRTHSMLEQSNVPGSVREIGDSGMRNGSH